MNKKFFLKIGVVFLILVFTVLSTTSCSAPYKEVKQDNGDIWIYPNGLHYDNELLEFSIDFPESWKNNVLIVQPSSEGIVVYLREAKENAPELNVGTVLFAVMSVDKNDEGRKAWAEAVNGEYFGESSNKTIYLSIYGGIMPSLIDTAEKYSSMGILPGAIEDSEEYKAKREKFDKAVKEMITLDNGKENGQ